MVGGGWVYLDYRVSSGPFLRFSMSFEFLSEMLDHSVSETRDPSLTISLTGDALSYQSGTAGTYCQISANTYYNPGNYLYIFVDSFTSWRVGPSPTTDYGRLATTSTKPLGTGPDDTSLEWYYNEHTINGQYDWVRSNEITVVSVIGNQRFEISLVDTEREVVFEFGNYGPTNN